MWVRERGVWGSSEACQVLQKLCKLVRTGVNLDYWSGLDLLCLALPSQQKLNIWMKIYFACKSIFGTGEFLKAGQKSGSLHPPVAHQRQFAKNLLEPRKTATHIHSCRYSGGTQINAVVHCLTTPAQTDKTNSSLCAFHSICDINFRSCCGSNAPYKSSLYLPVAPVQTCCDVL